LAAEFEYHLGKRVTLVAATSAAMRDALARVQRAKEAAGQPSLAPVEAAPIPLVKLQTEPPKTRRGVAPPPQNVTPQKVRVPRTDPVKTRSEPKSDRPASSEPKTRRTPLPFFSEPIGPAAASLELAGSPQAVVQALGQGAHSLAGRVVVFAVQNHELRLKAHYGVDEPDSDVVIRPSRLSLLGRALEEHLAFGQLSRHPDDQQLQELLGVSGQVWLAASLVAGHPALVVALAEFEVRASAQQLSKLAGHAATALARIIQRRRSR
jgi:hypothetical protein